MALLISDTEASVSELSDRKVKETDPNIMEEAYIRDEKDFQPWLRASEVEAREQQVFQDILRRRAGAVSLGSNCYISPAAHVLTTRFWLGENSWIAAGAIVRGHVAIGANSSINPSAHIAGKVVIGDGVRIAGLASIYGFNHGFDRTDVPIYQQAHTSKGVKIGNGTWIGASAVIIDGVTVGDHCIIAAGAVCTKDVPEYSIVAGNPAKIVRNRKEKYANIMVTSENVSLVRKILYSEDPFQDLPFSYPPDLQGWELGKSNILQND